LAFLVERIIEADPELAKVAAAAPRAMASPGAWPAVFSVPLRNPHFIGHDTELDKIRAGLAAGMAVDGAGVAWHGRGRQDRRW